MLISFAVQWDNEEQISDSRILKLIYLSNFKVLRKVTFIVEPFV